MYITIVFCIMRRQHSFPSLKINNSGGLDFIRWLSLYHCILGTGLPSTSTDNTIWSPTSAERPIKGLRSWGWKIKIIIEILMWQKYCFLLLNLIHIQERSFLLFSWFRSLNEFSLIFNSASVILIGVQFMSYVSPAFEKTGNIHKYKNFY